jgi:hypothetical protein
MVEDPGSGLAGHLCESDLVFPACGRHLRRVLRSITRLPAVHPAVMR